MPGFFGANINVNQGQAPPAVGPWGRLIRGMEAGNRGVQAGNARRGAVEEGIQRFQDLGTDESMRLAELLRTNPQGASIYADTFGGWGKLYGQYKNNALQAQAAGMRAQAAGTSSAEEYFQALVAADFDPQQAAEMAQSVAVFEKTQADTAKSLRDPKREIRTDVNGRPRYVDTGEPTFEGVEKAAPRITAVQQANMDETLYARERLRAMVKELGYDQEQTQNAISRGSDPFDFNMKATGPDRLLAQLWNKAKQKNQGDDPGWQPFMDEYLGVGQAESAPPPAQQGFIDGKEYQIEDPETGEPVTAIYNAERGGFEY